MSSGKKYHHYIQGCATARGTNERQEAAHCSGCAGLPVVVHAANVHDTKGGICTAKRAYKRYPSVQKFCAAAGYRGTFVSDLKEQLDLNVDISERIKPHQWKKLPWRWAVECTLSWLNHSRRLSKDYEISISSAEAMVEIFHLHMLLKRL